MSEDRRDGQYAQHQRRREDRLPEDMRPRYSQADLVVAIAAGVKDALAARDSEPTGIHALPERDPAIDAMKPRLHFTAQVVGVLVALAVAAAAVWAALAWTGAIVDDRVKGVLVRAQLACPETERGLRVDPRYACKTLPQQLGEIRDAQETTIEQLGAVLRRLPEEPRP